MEVFINGSSQEFLSEYKKLENTLNGLATVGTIEIRDDEKYCDKFKIFPLQDSSLEMILKKIFTNILITLNE